MIASPLPALADSVIPDSAEETAEPNEADRSTLSYFVGGTALSGVVVESRNNLDYPFSPQTGYWTIRSEAKKIVSAASDLEMNTIFYPATPNMTAMYRSRILPNSRYYSENPQNFSLKDPLKALVKESEEKGIAVCAVISPFEMGSFNETAQYPSLLEEYPDLVLKTNTYSYLDPKLPQVQEIIGKIAGELTSNYKINGVVLDCSTCMSRTGASLNDLKATLEQVAKAVRRRSPSTKIGIILPGDLLKDAQKEETVLFLNDIFEQKSCDFLMPNVTDTVGGENEYQKTISLWEEAISDFPNAELFAYQDAGRILAPLSEEHFYPDSQEILFQQFSNQINGISGSVVSSLHSVMVSPSLFENLITDAGSFWYRDSDLEKPTQLTVGNPSETISVDTDHYLITGSCSTALPLYLNGELYQGQFGEITSSGCFAFDVPLQTGPNRFTFSQGARSRTVTILRQELSEQPQTPIQEIIPESAYPSSNESVSVRGPVTLSCVAPSGAQVTALLADGTKYPLTQENASIEKGYPAKYSAALPLTESENLQVKNLGHISYSMVYDGQLRLQTSLGELIQIGSQQNLSVQIIDPLAPVFKDSSENQIIHTLVEGTKDYVTQSSENYFYLSSGGCIRKSAARVMTDKTDIYTISKRIKNVVLQSTDKGEYITLVGGKELPCIVDYNPEEHTVTLRLSHVLEIPQQLSYLESEMFDSIRVEKEDTNASIILTLKENMTFLGYQISCNENNIIIEFRSNVSPAEQFDPSRPLAGVNIVIDPGHGGKDTGAPSLLGTQGADEEALNLALGRALYDRLDALGANVFLTRDSHAAMAGLDRIMFAQYRDADLFLSIHHCAQDSEGILVTCNNEFSRTLAETVSAGLSKRLNRTAHPVQGSKIYVSEVTSCPAIGIHPAYLMDSSDYCSASNPVDIYRCAYQISEDVCSFLIQSNLQYQSAVSASQQQQ